MTPELEIRLERSLPPFDGDCVHNEDELSLIQLRIILVSVIGELENDGVAVFLFDDWHEHDGFIVDAQPTTWVRIKEMAGSDLRLFDSRHVDFGVRVAIFPSSFEWLLRFNIDDEVEADHRTATCDFDLTVASNSKAIGHFDTVTVASPKTLTRCLAAPWFRSNYGG